MTINLDLIKFVTMAAIGASVISTPVIQKIKEMLPSKKYLKVIAFFISFAIGECFTLTFTDLGAVNGIWTGIITWAGASAIYQAFENKLFTPFGEMNKPSEDDKDEIIIDRDGTNE